MKMYYIDWKKSTMIDMKADVLYELDGCPTTHEANRFLTDDMSNLLKVYSKRLINMRDNTSNFKDGDKLVARIVFFNDDGSVTTNVVDTVVVKNGELQTEADVLDYLDNSPWYYKLKYE